jgi:pyruvate dehydrogenase (quinone)
MRAMSGSPKFAASQTLPDVDFANFAASLGLDAHTVSDPDELSSVWKAALSADRPSVLDVHTDPNMPPIPPHATFEQAKATATAVLGGDEDSWSFIKQGIKTKAQEFLPHSRS